MRPTRSVLPELTLSTRAAGLEVAGVDAEVGQLADERVGHDLEGERGERLGVVGVAHDWPRRVFGSRPSTGGTSSGEGR